MVRWNKISVDVLYLTFALATWRRPSVLSCCCHPIFRLSCSLSLLSVWTRRRSLQRDGRCSRKWQSDWYDTNIICFTWTSKPYYFLGYDLYLSSPWVRFFLCVSVKALALIYAQSTVSKESMKTSSHLICYQAQPFRTSLSWRTNA